MSENVHDKQRLKELQALPLDRKIMITQTRIIEWYTKWKGQVATGITSLSPLIVLTPTVIMSRVIAGGSH